MSARRPSEVLAEATELLDRAQTVLVSRLADMTAAQLGWPASSGWGATPSGGSHWCWDHERDVDACHREGSACDGEVVAVRGDRTGETALRRDRAAAHRREVERLIVAVARDADRITQLLGLYGNRPATDEERQATRAENERDAGCVSCRRTSVAKGVQRWEPVFADDLCRWCYDWRRSTGALPAVSDLERHHRGERVRRPA